MVDGSWEENKSNYWQSGSERVMWEWSLRSWHILPFRGFMWIIKNLQKNFTSFFHTWTFYCSHCTSSQNEPAKRTHRVFFCLLLLLLGCLLIVLPIKLKMAKLTYWVEVTHTKRHKLFIFSEGGKTYISEKKLHEKNATFKKHLPVTLQTAWDEFDWQATPVCQFIYANLAFAVKSRGRV